MWLKKFFSKKTKLPVEHKTNETIESNTNKHLDENTNNIGEEDSKREALEKRFEKFKTYCIDKQFLFIRCGQMLEYNMDQIVDYTFEGKGKVYGALALVGTPARIQKEREKLYANHEESIWNGSYSFQTFEGKDIFDLINMKTFVPKLDKKYDVYYSYIERAIIVMTEGIILGSEMEDYYKEKLEILNDKLYNTEPRPYGDYYKSLGELKEYCLKKLGY